MKVRNVLILYIIAIVALVSVKLFFSIPTILTEINFDSQNIVVWMYAAQKGLLPYRDVFYPYGLLNYYLYKFSSVYLLYCILVFFLFLGLYSGINKIVRKSTRSFFIYFIIFTFIIFITKINFFARYGIVTVLGLYIGILFYNYVSPPKRILCLLGIITGLAFFLITDQSVYLFFLICIFIFLNPLLKQVAITGSLLYEYLYGCLFFFLGMLIGSLPFIFIFLHLSILNDFINFFLKSPDMAMYGKTPYFHSLWSSYGLFDFLVLFVSTSYLGFVFIIRKKKFDVQDYVILSYSLIFFMFEQKGIIRSIDYQVNFLGLLIALLLLNILFKNIPHFFGEIVSKGLPLLLIGLLIFLLKFPLPGYSYSRNIHYSFNNTYKNVIEKITKQKGYNGKVFSFPSDSILYVLTRQNPPFFFTVYDGSPRYAQNMSISYIKKNNIQYVIYDQAITSIQDGVPDYIRVPYEFSFIFRNFAPYDRVGNFVFMKKGVQDLFLQKDNAYNTFKNEYLNVDLGSVPRSEGIYKLGNIQKKPETTIHTVSNSDLNISSKNKFLLVHFRSLQQSPSLLKLTTKENLVTTIAFQACHIGEVCIINISNIPLFYRVREIKKIYFDTKYIDWIDVVNQENKENFW